MLHNKNGRQLLFALISVVILVLVEGSSRCAAASPQNQDQGQSPGQQHGSFPVGHATRILDVTGTRGETRHVNVHLWYPAPDPQNCQSGDGNSQGCPPSVYTSRLNGIPLLPQWDPLSWTIGSTVAFEELPVSSAQSSWPVIIFSHGDQNNAIDYLYTLEALASYGFIVAAPDHVNNTQDDVRIDSVNGQANSTVIPCFDDPPAPLAPCEVLDRVNPNRIDTPVACDNNPLIQTTVSVRESLKDRVADVRAIMDTLSTWFGSQADKSRIGVMGHSRGTVTALAAAGGSQCWKIDAADALHPVKAIMGLAIGAQNVTLRVDLPNVKVPTLLVAGSLDKTLPASKLALMNLTNLSSTDKTLVQIPNANHRHFDSGLCAQTQSSGVIAQAAEAIVGVPSTTRAILDLQTVANLLIVPSAGGVAMDYCGPDTFFDPLNDPPTYDIRSLVASLTVTTVPPNGFDFTSTNVPTTGLTSNAVKDQVVKLAVDPVVGFFPRVL